MAGVKDIGSGILNMMPFKKTMLHKTFPQVAEICDKFEAAHPCMAEEMYNSPEEYIKQANEKIIDFCGRLINETQLFGKYFEVASYIGGTLMYMTAHIEILKDELSKTKEKLSRYEDND